MAVALAGPDFTPAARDALQELAPDGVFEASQPGGLADAFQKLATRIVGATAAATR